MIFTFYAAQGKSVGASLVEEDKIDLADNFAPDAATQTVSVDAIPDGWMGLDIGPDSIETFNTALSDCKTVVWNGPMGVFEFDAFAKGTLAVADTLAGLTAGGCIPIIGGG